jgi:DNA-binding response OmpR family regulator
VTRRYHDVLLVEDDAALCRVVERNLAKAGAQMRTAASVAEALRAIGERAPDLLILDIDLPDRTGWDLIRRLSAEAVEIPAIVITGTRVTPERLAQFHPLAYLPKPFPIEALVRMVRGDANAVTAS